ncbi:unnamed protein product [Schistosoma curassoni]|uniref:Uncharacterized protein n=1 Tax=Schistosoma curassoni TaxID=6186 RepID=A0A183JU22_9TREM|nr:unnamed protein product [Schistosoma curassoni]
MNLRVGLNLLITYSIQPTRINGKEILTMEINGFNVFKFLYTAHSSVSKRNSIFIGSAAQRSRDVNRDSCFIQEAVDSSGIYIPGVDLLIDDSECEPIDLISRFSRTPISSPKIVDPGSTISCALAGPLSSSHIFNQLDSNVAQRLMKLPT